VFAAGVIHGILTGANDQDTLAFAHAAACLKHSVFGDYFPLGVDAVRHALSDASLDVRR
jgi:2-dehydro-3-deoxygluconokinase